MRCFLKLFLVVSFLAAIPIAGGEIEAASALRVAKTHIAEKRYVDAVKVLEKAVDSTTTIADDATKKEALTAIHFYLGVAYSGMGRSDEALFHVEEALRLSPKMKAVDPQKYSPEFVAIFQRAKSELSSPNRFEVFYPIKDDSPTGLAAAGIDSIAVELLGSKQEKREWKDAVMSEDRARFISAFWQRRTAAAGTNQFRETFGRRAAIANSLFDSTDGAGALSDRGRVYVLLGIPDFVRRRALTEDDPIVVMNRGSRGIAIGTIEFWGYTGENLPVPMPGRAVTFRFVTHQGVGDNVLQKDGTSMTALATAAAVGRPE